MVKKRSLDYKVRLLKFLIASRETFKDPDISNFWEYIARNYDEERDEDPDQIENYWDEETQYWADECEGTRKRRKGHEKDSQYDKLMTQWSDSWDEMLLDYWHWMVTKAGSNYMRYSMIPDEFRSKVEDLVLQRGKRGTKPGEARQASRVKKSAEKKMKNTPVPTSTTERPDFEYDGAKLQRVVEAAKARAMEVGKPDLAAAVHQIYVDSLMDMKLRVLLEKILTQDATKSENEQFQDYVRKAKRKLRDDKAAGTKTPAPKRKESTKTSPQVQAPKVIVTRTEEVMELDKPAEANKSGSVDPTGSDKTGSDRAAGDSGYGSERANDKAGKNASTEDANGESLKRRRESITSSQAAEAEDLEEAEERAAKRRKRAESEDSGEEYQPSQKGSARRAKSSAAAKVRNEIHERLSRDSSPLSEHDDTDIEEAKEAYVDEMVRRKSAEASRDLIEAEYGPVSPTVADDARSEPAESWKSMPSPTLPPAQPEPSASGSSQERQATAGAQNSTTQTNNSRALAKASTPAPSAEQLTPSETSRAFQLITGAAAEAVAPHIKRLEDKMDKLLREQKSNAGVLPTPSSTAANTTTDQALSSSQELMKIANSLQSSEGDGQASEITQLISQLVRNAAEASIHAAEAARKAGEMARDVSQVLMHVGGAQKKGEEKTAAAEKASSSSRKKH